MLSHFLMVLALSSTFSALLAQEGAFSTVLVKGEIEQEGGRASDNLTIELVENFSHVPAGRQPVMQDGSFEFHNVRPGEYELRINGAYGDLIHKEIVSIHNEGVPLEVKLPQRRSTSPMSGTISAAALRRHVSAKAIREMARSEQKLRQGDIQSSIAHLKKAIRIQPDYMEAYNNLGTRYMSLQDYEGAIAQFREAVRLDPAAVLAHTNLGLALIIQKDLPEAEAELRSAVRLDASSAKAHYLLGVVLNSEDRDPAEVVEHLDQSAREIPKARLLAAQVLALKGKFNRAVAELRQYLAAPHAENRTTVEAVLASFQSRVGSTR